MKLTRKIYLSIFTTMFILLTCVATTFAWVGMFSFSTLGSFDLNLKVEKLDLDYSLQISATGEENSFADEVSSIEIQKQIMKNMDIDFALESEESRYSSFKDYESYINYKFQDALLEPVTVGYDSINQKLDMTKFYSFQELKYSYRFLEESKKYFKFDLYLMIRPSVIQSSTSINANILFANITSNSARPLKGNPCGGDLFTLNPFSNIDPSDTNFGLLNGVDGKVYTNSEYASRLAFEVYNPIKINENYSTTAEPKSLIIYQGGTQLPSYSDGVYSFGGILPENYNLGLKELNTTYRSNVDITDKDTYNNYLYPAALYRYNNNIDKEFSDENKMIWNAPETVSTENLNYLGIEDSIQTKIKITCYFWFEGWDADCFRFIDKKNVSIKLVFATDMVDE